MQFLIIEAKKPILRIKQASIDFTNKPKYFYISLFVVVLILINLRQSRITNFGCEMCADKAGYYMYLPAVFYLGFNASSYEDSLDNRHGDGFTIERERNKIITKFTSGVALLLSPFYSVGVIAEKVFSLGIHPYSRFYLFFINFGAAFYVVLGLFFFGKWLSSYFDTTISTLSALIVFFGTNLYYYSLDETLMSHLYSFSMFSTLLYGLKMFTISKRFKHFLLFIVPFSIAVLIRPTNALFGVIALCCDINHLKDFKNKLILLFTPKYLIPGCIVFFAIFLPQLFYWKFAFGKYFAWSYQDEGFTFWNNPQFLIVWFSPQSGLFPYTPIVFLSLIVSIILIFRKTIFPSSFGNSLVALITFFIVSYMCASWNNPYFGICNFGKRPMVEYLPVLMLPISYLMAGYKYFSKLGKYLVVSLISVMVIYNLALFRVFNTCFFGDTWDWALFAELLSKAFLV